MIFDILAVSVLLVNLERKMIYDLTYINPADYHVDRGNNDDDEPFNDDDDDDDVEKDEEDKEEEEHLALADLFDVSTDDLVPSS
uniref:Uncharacterized protein n=1 Tax=Tanacetum cinerariifolium TaxID=118510 RepID=A0A699J3C2_TANCI|nr:hypothetical protein [Tanacetum cinerariifolium]